MAIQLDIFFLPFEIHIMVEGGGHETLHAAIMAQNGKNSFLSQKSQYFLLHLAWKGFFFRGGVSSPLCKWEMGIGVVFGGLGGLVGVLL